MSDKDLVQELKATISDLAKDKDDMANTIKTKESRIKQTLIKLEHATGDVKTCGHKIADQDKKIKDLEEKLKDKNKIVKKEIDEEIEKYITTNGTLENDDSTTHTHQKKTRNNP